MIEVSGEDNGLSGQVGQVRDVRWSGAGWSRVPRTPPRTVRRSRYHSINTLLAKCFNEINYAEIRLHCIVWFVTPNTMANLSWYGYSLHVKCILTIDTEFYVFLLQDSEYCGHFISNRLLIVYAIVVENVLQSCKLHTITLIAICYCVLNYQYPNAV